MNFIESPRQEGLQFLPEPGSIVRISQVVELPNGPHRVAGPAVEGIITSPEELHFTHEQAKIAGCVAVKYALPSDEQARVRMVQVKTRTQIVDAISPYRLTADDIQVSTYVLPA